MSEKTLAMNIVITGLNAAVAKFTNDKTIPAAKRVCDAYGWELLSASADGDTAHVRLHHDCTLVPLPDERGVQYFIARGAHVQVSFIDNILELHSKYAHNIFYRDTLDEFRALTPDIVLAGGVIRLIYSITENGNFKHAISEVRIDIDKEAPFDAENSRSYIEFIAKFSDRFGAKADAWLDEHVPKWRSPFAA